MNDPVRISQNTFESDGFLVVRGLRNRTFCSRARAEVCEQLEPLLGPAEFEADVGYPGAPKGRAEEGGMTPRRLLSAYARFSRLRGLAVAEDVGELLRGLGLGEQPMLSQGHHNCVMTKHPGYSSATLWHQDVRYWRFDRPELVSMWLALGDENVKNGALRVIPGSHLLSLDRGRLDAELFLRPELEENKVLIREAVPVELAAGDVLFFHSRLFHAAGKNRSSDVKLSAVFTYHAADNLPIPETRSAIYPSIPVR